MTNSTLPKHDAVLLGAGHTNAHVLRMWRMAPPNGVRLTCVSNFGTAAYSGMLPGTLAGLYPPERMQIDLVRLCAAAGVRLILADVEGLDLHERRLRLVGRPDLPFDVLSVGIGSVPRGVEVGADPGLLLPIKPMQTFLARLDARLEAIRAKGAWRVAIVGAGAGGVEICMCLPRHLAALDAAMPFELTLVDSHTEILEGAPPGLIRAARRELEAQGVRLVLGRRVCNAADGRLSFDDGTSTPADLAIWATSAVAPELLPRLGLPVDGDGFLLTRPTLQTVSDHPIFAVGDSGTCPSHPRPKAGVFAVRQGPVLWENIRRLLRGEPLLEYLPQQKFLSLLATGDRRAIMSYKGMTFCGRWCWTLKDSIDGRFMDKYQDYRPMAAVEGSGAVAGEMALNGEVGKSSMRCAGCGCKLPGDILSRVLSRLDIPPSDHVLLGLEARDDAAVIQPPGGRPIVATVDFFTAFVDDPFLVGRVAALNALSDVYALGARPLAALSMATVPLGPVHQQEQLLFELLSGALEELRSAGATLVGGHTIEAAQLMLGFTVLADGGTEPALRKSGLRPGDRLVISKPLGSGILLAAHMQARCRAAWMTSLVRTLLASNERAADVAREHGVSSMTDVTGFGLAGHLLEMLRASGMSAELRVSDVPLLDGVVELVSEGVESTLAAGNRAVTAEIEGLVFEGRVIDGRAERDMPDPRSALARAREAVLFDPQTSGGLLFGVTSEREASVLARLKDQGADAATIGTVVAYSEDRPRLRLR